MVVMVLTMMNVVGVDLYHYNYMTQYGVEFMTSGLRPCYKNSVQRKTRKFIYVPGTELSMLTCK
jgi:hypothetical protein